MRSTPVVHETRLGIATLEFVMCLPILLLLFVAILWLGKSFIALSEVSIGARNEAWQERHTGKASDAFKLKKIVGEVEKSQERKISLSPLFNGFADPTSAHLVLGGSWDYHQVLPNDGMNKQPNWKLTQRLAIDAARLKGESFDGSILNNLKQQLQGLDPMALVGQIGYGDLLGSLGGWSQTLDGASQQQGKAYEQAKQREKEKILDKIRRRKLKIERIAVQMSDDQKSYADVLFRQWVVTRGGVSPSELDEFRRLEERKQLLKGKLGSSEQREAETLFEENKTLEADKRALKAFDSL